MNYMEKLKIIKKLLKLTQSELAVKLKVSFPTLNSWINGRSKPKSSKLKLINDLYVETSGVGKILESSLIAKKEIILNKSKKFKNIIKFILNRPDIFDQLVLSFTYNTNSIEGSTLTENDTAAIIFNNTTLKNKDLIEHFEAKNHQSALDYLFKEIKLGFKITEDFILKLHSILMNSIRQDAGSYRNHGVRIVGANIPTANHLKIPDLMKNLAEEINKDYEDTIKHVALIHSKFEQIHPFSDGNGRVGRLIIAAMLLRKNIVLAVIKKEDKMFYYKSLQKAQKQADFESLEDCICDSVLNGVLFLND